MVPLSLALLLSQPLPLCCETDLDRFPPAGLVKAALNAGKEHLVWLDGQLTVCGWDARDEVLRIRSEVVVVRKVWEDLEELQSDRPFHGRESWFVRRLEQYRRCIGTTDYAAGRLPRHDLLYRTILTPAY